MALSILCSIVPFLFYKKGKWRKNSIFILISIICTIIMCTTYQASSGIYITLAIILGLKSQESKLYYALLSKSIISFLAGLIIFKLFILTPVDGYASNNFLEISNFIPGSIKNYQKYFQLFFSDFRWHWIIAICIVVVAFILSTTAVSRKKIMILVLNILSLLGIILLSFGLYPFMEKPIFASRAMYGIFINFAFMSIFAANYKLNYVGKICNLYLAYAIFVCALTYGNTVNIQKSYAIYRMGLVASDLNQIVPAEGNNILIDFDGYIGYAQPVTKICNKYPVISRIVPFFFHDDTSWWGDRYFRYYYGMNNYNYTGHLKEFDKSKMKLVKSTNMHNIYQNGNNVLVLLKKQDATQN